jgi:hypothetical protein
MKATEIIAAGITGTTFMTLFSEVVSEMKGSNYNEAEIIGQLVNRITGLEKQQARAVGYAAHATVGVSFAAIYAAVLKSAKVRPNLFNGLVYGLSSGLAGVLIWHATFKAHPNPPGVNLKNYYKQLVLAHLIFGVFTALPLSKMAGK